jgi:hypothetical protein
MPETVFTTRLTEADWDEALRGWRCPALSVPGAIVEALYVDGTRVDSATYEVLTPNRIIRWVPRNEPAHVTVSIKLTEDLTLGSETDRWKKLAIILPVIATIVSAGLSAAATYFSKSDNSSAVHSERKSQADPVQSPLPSQVADNTTISQAQELQIGRAEKGFCKGTSHYYKATLESSMVDPAFLLLVRNLENAASSTLLEAALLNADERQVGKWTEVGRNISVRPSDLSPGRYYLSVGCLSGFPVHYEVAIQR